MKSDTNTDKTVTHPYFGREYVGYVVNTPISPQSQQAIQALQQKYKKEFGSAIYISPPESLHITLMDWLAPLVDYGEDKDILFKKIFSDYDRALNMVVKDLGSITLHFDSVSAAPEAVFVQAKDSGQYQAIRDGFLSKIELLPNTKRPPKIIHSTLTRYLKKVDLKAVQDFTAQQSIDLVENIDFFRLVRTADTVMDNLRVIKRYDLK